MRKQFSNLLYKEIEKNKDIILLSGDLGYRLWDDIKRDFPSNFINPGSSEQLMMGMAVGLALDGKIPVVYSITPFLLYRPFEIIRNYLHYEKTPVKLVGGGRGKDYGHLGYTHWAEEDEQIMQVLNNIDLYRPNEKQEINGLFEDFIYSPKPSYLNLKK
jgi:transketolase